MEGTADMKAKSPNQSKQKRTDAPLKDLEPKQNPQAGASTSGTTIKFTLFNPDGTPLRSK